MTGASGRTPRDTVRQFIEAVPRQDFAALEDCLAPDVVQYYQRPTLRSDDGAVLAAHKRGRDAILEEIRDNFYVTLYRPGTVRLDIEHMVAEGEWVSAQFCLAGVAIPTGQPYENFYHFLYQVVDGQVVQYWEYVDTAYASAMLFPDVTEQRLKDYLAAVAETGQPRLADFLASDVVLVVDGRQVEGRGDVAAWHRDFPATGAAPRIAVTGQAGFVEFGQDSGAHSLCVAYELDGGRIRRMRVYR